MDITKFTELKTGQLIKIDGGRTVTHAFIPDELPLNWRVPTETWHLIAEGREAIGSLNGIGKHLPNPHLLLGPLQFREAQVSSKLEGTITDPQQQLLFEFNIKPTNGDEAELSDLKEVSNYRRALNYQLHIQEKLPLSLRLIRELHKILLTGVRGASKQPGIFRNVQAQIGRPARFVPPPPNYLLPLLDNLEKYLHTTNQFDPIVDAFIVHYQLEAIHPFRDGNGRVGRLLLAIMISERCNLTHNWLYMSAFFEKNKNEYMDRLFNISSMGDWKGWIDFCMRGVIEQAKDTESRCERLLQVSNNFKERISQIGGSYRLNAIADNLFAIPLIQISTIAREYQVSYPTAKSDIERLLEVEILEEPERTHPRTFYSPEILQIIFEE